MSISLMTQVWKSELPSVTKMVLLALCDNANDQGECYPSVQMLAQKCSLSDRAVQKHITDLESMGVVTRGMRNGRSTIYYIDLRTLFTPEPHSPPNIVHPTPERRSPPPPNIVHPTPERRSPITIKEPSIEPSKKHKREKKGFEDDFDFAGKLSELGVDRKTIRDWLAVRKIKRAANTETAIDHLVREAAKAKISVADAVLICATRSWQGFESEWLKPKAQASPSTKTKAEKDKDFADRLTGRKQNEQRSEHHIIDLN